LKDGKALPVLKEMMDLKPTGKPDDDAMAQSAKLAAIEASKELADASLRAKVQVLSKNDPDLKVREAALDALKK
jgi:hypothetical protein